MNIFFEFAAAVREKAGVPGWKLQVEKEAVSVLDALKELEAALPQRTLEITAGSQVRKDVLIFMKDPTGRQFRVTAPQETELEPETIILLASPMGGG